MDVMCQPFSKSNKFESLSYPAHLQAKLAELCDFVEANLTEAAHHQQARSQDYQKGGYLRNIITREACACVHKHARLGGPGGMPPQEIFKI